MYYTESVSLTVLYFFITGKENGLYWAAIYKHPVIFNVKTKTLT